MSDGLQEVWDLFSTYRTKQLASRFPGPHRAIIVETNDPLRMHRIRIKCPELHDFDLNPEDCPWAIPSPIFGGRGAGSWQSPVIGDWVWIEFEKDHPYSPVYTGFCTPTRRKFYPLPSIYGTTPIPVDENSDVTDLPNDYTKKFLPLDGRPMSAGWVDRYGNLEIASAVGFFPSEHDVAPPTPGIDPITRANFDAVVVKPKNNEPDSKFMAKISKYGHILQQSDIGYEWKKDSDTENGEFTGNFDEDHEWEIARWKYLQRVLHEDKESGKDQRKFMVLTRYGHKLELRDVGFKYTRDGEYGFQKVISKSDKDERWVKLRTKGGHLIQAIDIGFDARDDDYVKRTLLDEISRNDPLDEENKFGDDGRQLRFLTRSGLKLVLDDRGSDKKKAHSVELANNLIGTGILLKGRATPGSGPKYAEAAGNPIGYFLEFNERNNYAAIGSPLGQAIEVNDSTETVIACTRIPTYPQACQFLGGNEFTTKSLSTLDSIHLSHHLLLDLEHEVIRLKSRANKGKGPDTPMWGDADSGEQAGLEIHDAPSGNPWVELVDHDDRGLWFSRSGSLTVLRSKQDYDMAMWMFEKPDSTQGILVIRNGTNGRTQIICNGSVDIYGKHNVKIESDGLITMKAAVGIHMQVGANRFRMNDRGVDTNQDVRGRHILGYFPQIHDGIFPPPGRPSGTGAQVERVKASAKPKIKPENRL